MITEMQYRVCWAWSDNRRPYGTGWDNNLLGKIAYARMQQARKVGKWPIFSRVWIERREYTYSYSDSVEMTIEEAEVAR